MRFASLAVIALAIGCSDDHSHETATINDACSDGGAYERVHVTDEACRSYVEAESRSSVVTDAAKAPAWTTPAPGIAKVTVAPPAFAWSKGTLARSPWKRLIRLIDPLPEAWAHGDTTGDAYVLHFRDGAGKELHRVMTDKTEYTPTAAIWDRVRASGTVTVSLVGVRFTANVIASGTKPTAADPRTFTVE